LKLGQQKTTAKINISCFATLLKYFHLSRHNNLNFKTHRMFVAMKKYLFLLLLIASSASAQQLPKIEINNLSIALNGKDTEFIPELTLSLDGENQFDFTLFEENGLSVGVFIELHKQGRRLRLDQRTYVETPDGKRKFSNRYKHTDFQKTNESLEFSGRLSEHITYDPVLLKRIFASFNYTIHY
jgi:hypothetical protein